MAHLNKRTIEALKPQEKDVIVFDEGLPGFGVRVYPSGRKIYLVQYRSSKRTRRVKIGRHGVLTFDEAKRKAKDLLGTVAKGDNPAQEIDDHRKAPTMASVCDRFMRDYVEVRLKPNTRRDYARALEKHVKPAFGAFKVVDVTRADVAQLHHKMRKTPYQANRTLAVMSRMFNMCEIWGLRADGSNPCRLVEKNKERSRETYLSREQMRLLGEVLDECEGSGSESLYTVAAFRLLLLTGCRLSEIQNLKWSYVQAGTLVLPDSKTGPRRIPLPQSAIYLLDQLPRQMNNDYVICGEVPGQNMINLQKPWRRIRQRAGLDHVRIHDLRHTYASHAVQKGLSLAILGQLLGHASAQTTMRYAHLDDQTKREASEFVTSTFEGLIVKPRPTGAPHLNVIK